MTANDLIQAFTAMTTACQNAKTEEEAEQAASVLIEWMPTAMQQLTTLVAEAIAALLETQPAVADILAIMVSMSTMMLTLNGLAVNNLALSPVLNKEAADRVERWKKLTNRR